MSTTSASTISVLSMTYRTPVPLVDRPGCLFCFFFFFFSGALVSAETPPWENPETLDVTIEPFRPEASNSFFLASSCASSFLPFRSCSNFHISFCPSYFWSFRFNTQLHILSLCFFSILCLLGQVDRLLMQLLDFSHQLLHLCGEGSDDGLWNWSTQGGRGRGLTRLQEGDWHQNRISPKLGQEFLLPELVPPPLAGPLAWNTHRISLWL